MFLWASNNLSQALSSLCWCNKGRLYVRSGAFKISDRRDFLLLIKELVLLRLQVLIEGKSSDNSVGHFNGELASIVA